MRQKLSKKQEELDVAEKQRQDITLEIQEIQTQLGNKQKTNEKGKRLSPNEYWAWKTTTQEELNTKLGQLRTLKTKTRELRVSMYEPHSHSCKIIKSLLLIVETVEDEDLSTQEKEDISAARRFVTRPSGLTSQTTPGKPHQ